MTNDLPSDDVASRDAFPPPVVPDRPRRRSALIAGVAVAVAFALGVVAGALLFGGDDDAGKADEPDVAGLACSAFSDLDVAGLFAEGDGPDEAALFQLQGAALLAQAAGAADETYGRLGEQGEAMVRALQMFDREGAVAAAADVAEECSQV